MTATASKTMSVEEYREFQKRTEYRHEYVDGVLIERSPASRRHNDIGLNLICELHSLATARGLEFHTFAVLTRTRPTRFRYPDLIISRDPGRDPYLLENPCFIAEITSEATAQNDHGMKLEEYTKLPSIEQYAIISQDKRFMIVYKPVNGIWTFEAFSGEGEFEIPCLETKLSLDQIYQGISF